LIYLEKYIKSGENMENKTFKERVSEKIELFKANATHILLVGFIVDELIKEGKTPKELRKELISDLEGSDTLNDAQKKHAKLKIYTLMEKVLRKYLKQKR
jgi:hypothetical protein